MFYLVIPHMQKKVSYGTKENRALDLWVKLAKSYSVISKKTSDDILKHDVTLPQFSVMEVLYHKGEMTIGELCKRQLVSGGNLVRDGFVERIPKPDDRRAVIIRLTEKGHTLIKDIFPDHAKLVANVVSALSSDEQKQLALLLKKLGTSVMEQ
jgi:MarR family transcriptional regulator, 2-MHQ and catechol-resistance regulon repressor